MISSLIHNQFTINCSKCLKFTGIIIPCLPYILYHEMAYELFCRPHVQCICFIWHMAHGKYYKVINGLKQHNYACINSKIYIVNEN